MRLHELLNWSEIAAQLVGLYRREASGAGGPEPYAPLSMFKAMLLGQWHGLSDSELEHALKVRLDFMVFTGFEPGGVGFPDASTICRFRSRLVKAQLDQRLLAVINEQLRRAGLMVEQATGAVIDATIIASAARPNAHVEVGEHGQAQPVTSADAEAPLDQEGGQGVLRLQGLRGGR